MPDHPEWVRTAVTAIAGLSSPAVFCDAPGLYGQRHQCRTEVKLKEWQGALEPEAVGLVALLLLRGLALSAGAEDSRRIDGVGFTLFGLVAVAA